jgi:lipoprotein-releasing system ATP-binding protein
MQDSRTLRVLDLRKSYPSAAGDLHVLDGVSLALGAGDSLAIMGPSGSGKSTLLHILGTLDTPTAGSVLIDGLDPFALAPRALAAFRNRSVGFVFQDHYLLPQLTVLENVLIPTLVAPGSPGDAEARARELIARVGLAARADHRPAELSGGERQRAAVARALINRPALLLCDEPTGNLDADAALAVRGVLLDLHRELRGILIAVTHSVDLASAFPRVAHLRRGRLEETSRSDPA